MEATDDEIAAAVANVPVGAADTAPDDSDSWSPTPCPSCGNGVLVEVVTGPSEAHLAPCGCRVAPGSLERQRD